MFFKFAFSAIALFSAPALANLHLDELLENSLAPKTSSRASFVRLLVFDSTFQKISTTDLLSKSVHRAVNKLRVEAKDFHQLAENIFLELSPGTSLS